MSFEYKTYAFDKSTATLTICFDGHEAMNYNAPRANGVYLSGDALETYIQNLHPTIMKSLNFDMPVKLVVDEATQTEVVEQLAGDELQAFMLTHPNYVHDREIIESQLFTDDPSTITGGEDIEAKYQAYIDSVV